MRFLVYTVGFLRKRRPHSARIVLAYLKLQVLRRVSPHRQHLSLLGYKVAFEDFQILIFLFEEIFLAQDYWFESTRPDPVIFDAGANIGISLLFFKLHYPEATLHCFEPDPDNLTLLKQNVAHNNLSHVHVHPIALAEKRGEITMSGEQLATSTVEHRDSLPRKFTASTVPLSEFITEPIDLLKIDIEGAEGMVISEVAAKLDKVDQVILEYHQFSNNLPLSKILSVFEANDHRYAVVHWTYDLTRDMSFCVLKTRRVNK